MCWGWIGGAGRAVNGHEPRQILCAEGIRRYGGHQAGAFGGAGHLLHRVKGIVTLHGYNLLHGVMHPSFCTNRKHIMQKLNRRRKPPVFAYATR